MGDDTKLGIAIADLDELIDALQVDIKAGGFDNDSVMWLIKAWTKVVVLAREVATTRRPRPTSS